MKRRFGSFSRLLRLPFEIKDEKVDAALILSYATEPVPAWNVHVVGVIIAIAAIAALIAFQKCEEWVNTALAPWRVVNDSSATAKGS